MADEKPSGAFGAPEYEDLPWYLRPFSGRLYGNAATGTHDYLKGQFEAGDNKDLLSGAPQAKALISGAFSPIQTAKNALSGAWDFLGQPIADSYVRSRVAQEGPPIFDDGGGYVSGANAQPLDALNAASIAPIGAMGARASGLTREAAPVAIDDVSARTRATLDAWENPKGPRFDGPHGYGLARSDFPGTYRITKDGAPIGQAAIDVRDGVANVGVLHVDGGPNALGLTGMRDLREAFRGFYPEVTEFTSGPGQRVSGARRGPASAGTSATQTVRLSANDSNASLPSIGLNAAGSKPSAATRINGKIYTGPIHSESMAKATEGLTGDALRAAEAAAEDGFLVNGKFLRRDEAARLLSPEDPHRYVDSQHYDIDRLSSKVFANPDSASLPSVALNAMEQPRGAFATREIDPRGFYSPSLEAAKGLTQQSGTVQQFKSQLLKAGGKPKELEAVGFDRAFPDPNAKVTRQEIEDFLRANRVELGETRYGGDAPDEIEAALRKKYRENGMRPDEAAMMASRVARSRVGIAAEDPRFESYSTPGGIPGSYRESVTTMPGGLRPDQVRAREAAAAPFHGRLDEIQRELDANWDGPDRIALLQEQSDLQAKAWQEALRAVPDPQTYTSSHWPGVTNPLLHYRTKDFPGVEGSNTRVLDELQSDWGQRARDQGTRDPAQRSTWLAEREKATQERADIERRMADDFEKQTGKRVTVPVTVVDHPSMAGHPLQREWSLVQDRMSDLNSKINAAENGVPSAPFISNTSDWVDLGLKQVLADAARDPSVSRLAWAPGDVQAQRYGMEQHASAFRYSPDTQALQMKPRGADHDGWTVVGEHSPEDLSGVIGKELSERLLAAERQPMGRGSPYDAHVLDLPEGMTFGGEGHKKFYGTMSPEGYQSGIVGTRLQKLVKGLDPGAARIDGTVLEDVYRHNPETGGYDLSPDQTRYPSIPMTEAMRRKILEEGLPLFLNPATGAIPAEILQLYDRLPERAFAPDDE